MELVREVGSVSLATQSQFVIKRPFWSLFERTFRVFTRDGQLIMMVRHPLLRFREEFMVFADEAKSRPLLRIKSRQFVAINFNYDVFDAVTGQHIGTVQNRGLRSIVRDKFRILGPDGVEIGEMEEQGAALLRRFIPLLTSSHQVRMHGQVAARIRQVFRFWVKEFEVDLLPGVAEPRFVLACALLALMAESRREDR